MSARSWATAGAAASYIVLGMASPALAVCDAYSGNCPSAPPAGKPIGGGTDSPGSGTDNPGSGNGNAGSGNGQAPGGSGSGTGSTTSNPSALPFTGGELVLLSAIGAGAIAGGTALVVAGRRRGQSPA